MSAPTGHPLTDTDLAALDDGRLRDVIEPHRRLAAEFDRHGWKGEAAIQCGRMDRALDEWLVRQTD